MCKLLIAFKKNNSQLSKFEKIIKAQENSLLNQPHGIGGLIIDKNNQISVKRELVDYGKVFNWVYGHIKNAKVVIIHTRQATDGEIDDKNIHLFNLGGYFFAHNGIVLGFSKVGLQSRYAMFPQKRIFSENFEDISEISEKEIANKNQMSDSYHFLKKLEKPVTKTKLTKHIENTGFAGVGVLIGEQEKKIIVFATRNFVANTDFKNYSVVYSYEPEKNLFYYKTALGFPIVFKEKNEKIKTYPVVAGIYEIKYVDWKSVESK